MSEFYIVFLQTSQMAILEHYAYQTPKEAIAKFKELEKEYTYADFSIACEEDIVKPHMKLYSCAGSYTVIAYKESL